MKKQAKKDEVEEMVKKNEAEWKEAFEKDGAKMLMNITENISAQVSNLQEQIDTYHPEEQMNRVLGMLTIQVKELTDRLEKLDKSKDKADKKDLI
jgi:hypothetical protein